MGNCGSASKNGGKQLEKQEHQETKKRQYPAAREAVTPGDPK
jgi:hypothetical protein